MDFKQLAYFQQVTRDLNFSKAAKHLYLSQQALSKAISNLERELGTTLFERTASGLVLTVQGQEILEQSEHVTVELDRLYEIARKVPTARQRIRIGFTTVTIGDEYDIDLASVLSFEKIHPSVGIEVLEASSDACLSMLEDNDLDIAVVIAPIEFLRFSSHKLFEQEALPVVSTANPLARLANVQLAQLQGQTFYIPFGSTASINDICGTFYRAGLEPPSPGCFVMPDCTPHVMLDYVYLDRGIALMPIEHRDLIDESRGKILSMDRPFTISRCVASLRSHELTLWEREFRDYLIHLFSVS